MKISEKHSVGDSVEKVSGYKFSGVIVSSFTKTTGETRYVVECTVAGAEGMLHIFNHGQLRKVTR